MTVDYFELMRDITTAHADQLRNGDDVTVATVMVAVHHCPSCGGPLLTANRVGGYCVGCGKIDIEALT